MKLVYIAHPVSGDVPRNLMQGREFVQRAYMADVAPLAPWITGCEVLDDNDPVQREIGLLCDETTVTRCDEIWLCGPRVSEGMKRELAIAEAIGLTVRRFEMPADITEVYIKVGRF